jgi:hypothetical protein
LVKESLNMSSLSIPHGGVLINRMVSSDQRPEFERRAGEFPKVTLNARERSDLDLIAVGAYSPIEGFMGRKDYESVRDTMHLANGLPWSLPIILAVGQDQASSPETAATSRWSTTRSGGRDPAPRGTVSAGQGPRGALGSTAPRTERTPASITYSDAARSCWAAKSMC